MGLPAPTTLSPGKLELIYVAGALEHRVGTNFGATVDITVVPPIRTEAIALAPLVAACMPNTCSINSWRITNAAGVALYEEAFTTPIVGTATFPTDMLASESATSALTGKGAPAVGLAAGQVKYTIFQNAYSPGSWSLPKRSVTSNLGWAALRTHLNTSTLVGCDFYGSPAVWRTNVCYQINAHYQKKYGI